MKRKQRKRMGKSCPGRPRVRAIERGLTKAQRARDMVEEMKARKPPRRWTLKGIAWALCIRGPNTIKAWIEQAKCDDDPVYARNCERNNIKTAQPEDHFMVLLGQAYRLKNPPDKLRQEGVLRRKKEAEARYEQMLLAWWGDDYIKKEERSAVG